jgi:hypothetical protein
MDVSEDPRALHRQALCELAWRKLVEHGATKATVTLSGSGDSGRTGLNKTRSTSSSKNPACRPRLRSGGIGKG